MNVTFTTVVSYSVATSSSEFLPNDGEKHNQSNSFLFPKYNYGKISMKCANLPLSTSGIYKYTERMVILGNLVHSVSIIQFL